MNTSRRRRPNPGLSCRLKPGLDALETRLALSAAVPILPEMATSPATTTTAVARVGTLSVDSSEPARGRVLTHATDSITIGFDRAILPSSLSTDLLVQSANPDGSWTSIPTAESLTPAGTGIVLTPDEPLGPGHYRVVPVAGSFLQGADGSALPPGGVGTVSDFTVRTVGAGPADAIVLGSPTTGRAVAGSLDLEGNPGDVRLYRVELPQGHLWRLGAVVDAGRIGSPLEPELAVFDASGRPVAVAQQARPGFPNDPYLYTALDPGVYYIGVSGEGNVPGTVGGYDPSTSQPGSAQPGLSSGAFRLRLVADPADNPTGVAGFTIDAADPATPVPTGLSLSFGGPMDEAAMRNQAGSLIKLVDASGRAYAAHAVGYDEASATVHFLFDQKLPAGRYTIQLGATGALVDLAGRAPVAAGLPQGALGAFRVAPTATPSNPNDFGPLFFQAAQKGLKAASTLGPAQSTSYRFVVTLAGYYDLETTYGGAAPMLSLRSSGAASTLDPGRPGQPRAHLVYLEPGVVFLDATAGSAGTSLNWTFQLNGVEFDQLLDNGVSNVDALSLRLITPSTSSPGLGAGAYSSGGSAPAPAPAPTPAPATASATTAAPTGQYLAAAPGPVGHPTSMGESVGAVGPVTPSGSASLASASPDIPEGIIALPRTRGSKPLDRGTPTTQAVPEEAAPAVPDVGPDLATNGGLAPSPGRTALEAPIDPGAFDRIASTLSDLFAVAKPSGGRAGASIPDDLALAAIEGAPVGEPATAEPAARADLAASFGVGVIAVAVAHAQRQLGRWIERRRGRLALRLAQPTPAARRTEPA